MTNADLQHFDSYRDQTKIKHRILQQYLWAFLTALKGANASLIYIDAFAGRGRYREGANEYDGSPLLAIKMLAADRDLGAKVKATFVEREPGFAAELKRFAESLPETGQLASAPQFVNLDFAAFMDQFRQSGSEFQRSRAPVFLFVDPCGVDGVKLSDVVEVLKRDQSEVFVFFNYEGVNRICGAAAASGESSTLNDLLGTRTRVAALLKSLASAKSPAHREQYILAAYRAALSEESGARYTLAFRVEAEERRSTSHYFLHAAKHPLAFKIMKHVMWEASAGGSSLGGLELLQSSNTEPSLFMRADLHEQEKAILFALSKGPCQVKLFCEEWVSRPADLFSEKAYKQCLLRLENESKIEVLSKDGKLPVPRDKRPHPGGKPTLGNDYWVRLVRVNS